MSQNVLLISCMLSLSVPSLYNHSNKCPINKYVLLKAQSKSHRLSTSFFSSTLFFSLRFVVDLLKIFTWVLQFTAHQNNYMTIKRTYKFWKTKFNPQWNQHSNIKMFEFQWNWHLLYMNVRPTCWESPQTQRTSTHTRNKKQNIARMFELF